MKKNNRYRFTPLLFSLGLLIQASGKAVATQTTNVPKIGPAGAALVVGKRFSHDPDFGSLPHVYRSNALESKEQTLALIGDYEKAIQWLRTKFTPLDMAGLGVHQERIAALLKNGPAADAGLALGDQIVSIDGRPVQGLSDSEITQILRLAKERVILRIRPDVSAITEAMRVAEKQIVGWIQTDEADFVVAKKPFRMVETSVDVNEEVIASLENRILAVRRQVEAASALEFRDQAPEIDAIRKDFELPFWAALASLRAWWPAQWDYAKP
jgi:membrane-associated protease RseP (regulator of RpoE activity)